MLAHIAQERSEYWAELIPSEFPAVHIAWVKENARAHYLSRLSEEDALRMMATVHLIPEAFKQYGEAENLLMADYIRNKLDASEREDFEKKYLEDESCGTERHTFYLHSLEEAMQDDFMTAMINSGSKNWGELADFSHREMERLRDLEERLRENDTSLDCIRADVCSLFGFDAKYIYLGASAASCQDDKSSFDADDMHTRTMDAANAGRLIDKFIREARRMTAAITAAENSFMDPASYNGLDFDVQKNPNDALDLATQAVYKELEENSIFKDDIPAGPLWYRLKPKAIMQTIDQECRLLEPDARARIQRALSLSMMGGGSVPS